jgi:hypothetical protein
VLQNKKVAIYIAIDNHYSLLDTILKGLEPFRCTITLFTSPALNDSYAADPRVSKRQTISQTTIITKVQIDMLNHQDFVIFDELTSFKELMSFAYLNIKVPKIMIIHDCNSWFNPSMPKGVKNLLKYAFTKLVKQKFNVFAVAGSNMKRYLKKEFPNSNVFLIPFRYADFDEAIDISPQYIPGDLIRICIPGTISKRRNYDAILDNLCVTELKNKLIIDILGKAIGDYGSKIVSKIDELNNQGYNILYKKDYINNDSFDESVRKANVILSDFDPVYSTNNGQTEVYGITKETGVPVLMLNKAKIGLLPASFNQMEEIKNQTLFYKDGLQLAEILISIYNGTFDDFNQLQLNALGNAKKMEIALISKEIEAAYQLQLNAN